MDNNLNILLNKTADIALRRRAKWIIKNLNPKNGQRILDLGCGDGFYLYLLSNLDLNLTLVGVDSDKNALNSAKKRLDQKKVKLVQADLMKKLPFSDDFFDGIVMSEVMEHLPDDIKCMKEVRRVLKKNGRLVLSIPHINYPFFWDPINWTLDHLFNTHIKSCFWAGIWNQHLRLYTQDNLQNLLKKGGFKKATIAKLTHYCLPFNHYIINIVAIILAGKKMPNIFQRLFSKYEENYQTRLKRSPLQRNKFSLFAPIFFFDRLNDNWNEKGSAVSLVAVCEK